MAQFCNTFSQEQVFSLPLPGMLAFVYGQLISLLNTCPATKPSDRVDLNCTVGQYANQISWLFAKEHLSFGHSVHIHCFFI